MHAAGDVSLASDASVSVTKASPSRRRWIGRGVRLLNPWSWMGYSQAGVVTVEAKATLEDQRRRSSENSSFDRIVSHADEASFRKVIHEYLVLRMAYFERHFHEERFQNQEIEAPEIWLIPPTQDPYETRYNEKIKAFDANSKRVQKIYNDALSEMKETLKQSLQFHRQVEMRNEWRLECYEDVRASLFKTFQGKVLVQVQSQIEKQYEGLVTLCCDMYALQKELQSDYEILRRKIDTVLRQAIFNHLVFASGIEEVVKEEINEIHENWRVFAKDYRKPEEAIGGV